MRTYTKVATIGAAAYILLWLATWQIGPGALQAQMMRAHGRPHVEVKMLSCPAPFFFRAEYSRVVDRLNGSGAVGSFLWLPWRVYTLSEVPTWIS